MSFDRQKRPGLMGRRFVFLFYGATYPTSRRHYACWRAFLLDVECDSKENTPRASFYEPPRYPSHSGRTFAENFSCFRLWVNAFVLFDRRVGWFLRKRSLNSFKEIKTRRSRTKLTFSLEFESRRLYRETNCKRHSIVQFDVN